MINKIVDRLYVGDVFDANMLNFSNPEVITAVLNVCEEKDDFSKLSWMKYLHIPFPDHKQIPKEAFDKCMEWLEQRYKTQGRILIHCAIGHSRSPVICAAFMTKMRLVESMAHGLYLVKTARPQICPDPIVAGSAEALLVMKVQRV